MPALTLKEPQKKPFRESSRRILTKRKADPDSLKNEAPLSEKIRLRRVFQNNLKGFDLDLSLGKLTVVTGLSGSGKSSLVFDTLYAEGQRRYVETFSPYARQFMDRLDAPRVESIEGIPPAIAIQQGNTVKTSRSTVGTLTELCDYFKLLMPHLARLVCPGCGKEVKEDTVEGIAKIWMDKKNEGVLIGFQVNRSKGLQWEGIVSVLIQQGYHRWWNGSEVRDLKEIGKDPRQEILVVQDRMKITAAEKGRLIEAMEAAFRAGKGRLRVVDLDSCQSHSYSEGRHCASCDRSFPEPAPSLFSFNNPRGACTKCRGFGRTIEIDENLVIPDRRLSLRQGVIKPWQSGVSAECQTDLLKYCRRRKIDPDRPFSDLPALHQRWILEGDPDDPGDTGYGPWYGVRGYFRWLESKSYKMHVRVLLSRYREYRTCSECQGNRFQPETLLYRLGDRNLAEIYEMPVRDLRRWLMDEGGVDSSISERDPVHLVAREISNRLALLEEVGLGYLTLSRTARTLSGGEVQRVSLTTCLGSSVVQTLFILDEPSVGLHSRDISRLMKVLHSLRDRGNTVVVVEHDAAMIRAADELVDLGPRAGEEGGHLVLHTRNLERSLSEHQKKPTSSLTLAYLSGEKKIELAKGRRKVDGTTPRLSIQGAAENNLKNISVEIPLGRFVCVTGVSGSGKSTLVHHVLYENLQRLRGKAHSSSLKPVKMKGTNRIGEVVLVDQSPIGRTSRSNPAVYVGAWSPIRELYGSLEQSLHQGFSSSDFSFNSGQGRCERCGGNGVEKIEMQFLPDVWIQCPLCRGRRFKEALLQVQLEGRNISDLLDMTVVSGLNFFRGLLEKKLISSLSSARQARLLDEAIRRLELLCKVGLGYLKVGQSVSTLSGGESQRLKLCGFLAESPGKDAGQKLFIFDEPTTGLHFEDVAQLIHVFQQLVEEGHSVLVIEHHLDMIRSADWIIDLGPEAGDQGGEVVAVGTPEEVSKHPDSHTGRYLRPLLESVKKEERFGRLSERGLEEQGVDEKKGCSREIRVSRARENNLKNISLSIPRDQMVVITGLSGSGKSTLAFDLIFSEGQRRFLDCMSTYARQYVEQMPRPDMDLIEGIPPTVAIEQRITRGGWKSTVATITEAYHYIRLLFAKVGVQYCPRCNLPIGEQTRDEALKQIRVELKKGSRRLLVPMVRGRKGFHEEIVEWASARQLKRLRVDGRLMDLDRLKEKRLERYVEHHIDLDCGILNRSLFDPKVFYQALEWGHGTIFITDPSGTRQQRVISTSRVCASCQSSFEPLDPKDFSFNSPSGWCPTCQGYGVCWEGEKLEDLRGEEEMERDQLMERRTLEGGRTRECPDCKGARLKKNALHVEVRGMTLKELNQTSVKRAREWFEKLSLPKREQQIARDILPQIIERLKFMKEVGLDYLGLGRSAITLSGGEAQRIRLASQLGSNLKGVLYVLDEPTIGLHSRDNERLLGILDRLKQRGNSLLVVEHDEETMKRADWLIDLGPGAGKFGGEVVWAGHPGKSELGKSKGSRTLEFLHNPMKHPSRGSRRSLKDKSWITVQNASLHNLKGVMVKIPLGCLVAVTGVSGAGKSSLVRGTVLPGLKMMKDVKGSVVGGNLIDGAYEVDQSPIGKTPRSCPATYVGVWDEIRRLFASTPLSKMRGYSSSRFSFNTAEGRCENCEGQGRVKLKMSFLPDVYVPCESCKGMRFSRQTQDVMYREKTIAEVLKMSVEEAAVFFSFDSKIAFPLQLLNETGLGYLSLGQSSPTLSGGEAQRLKLVTELMRGRVGARRNLYVLEEPSIGLHFADVEKLIAVLHRLVDSGHTVVVVEHHLDLIAEADYVIDLGPEGGERGGRLVVAGSPEKIAGTARSETGRFLKSVLSRKG